MTERRDQSAETTPPPAEPDQRDGFLPGDSSALDQPALDKSSLDKSAPAAAADRDPPESPGGQLPSRDLPLGRAAGWLCGFLLLSVVIGICVGVLWAKVVTPPSYRISKDGSASLSEQGLTEVFGADAWFAVFGFVISIGLGIIAWRWFGKLGWPVVIVAIVGALTAAVVCWYVGYSIGPGDLVSRMAQAEPGDTVPIALTLRSPVTVIVWPFGAIIPVLLRASLGPDEEEAQLPPPRSHKRRAGWLRRRTTRADPAAADAASPDRTDT